MAEEKARNERIAAVRKARTRAQFWADLRGLPGELLGAVLPFVVLVTAIYMLWLFPIVGFDVASLFEP